MLIFLKRSIMTSFIVLVMLIIVRQFVEARYLPSTSMEPSLRVGDRFIVEKVNRLLGSKFTRGEIVVFYPPPIEMGGKDLPSDPNYVLGRLTGVPLFPQSAAFVKRVIGLPGDQIKICAGQGVFVNGQLMIENYVSELPNYDMNVLGDIGGRDVNGDEIRPYDDGKLSKSPVVVPEGELFLMGDNRNNSEDSHCFGFVKRERVIGRAFLRISPEFEEIKPPTYQ